MSSFGTLLYSKTFWILISISILASVGVLIWYFVTNKSDTSLQKAIDKPPVLELPSKDEDGPPVLELPSKRQEDEDEPPVLELPSKRQEDEIIELPSGTSVDQVTEERYKLMNEDNVRKPFSDMNLLSKKEIGSTLDTKWNREYGEFICDLNPECNSFVMDREDDLIRLYSDSQEDFGEKNRLRTKDKGWATYAKKSSILQNKKKLVDDSVNETLNKKRPEKIIKTVSEKKSEESVPAPAVEEVKHPSDANNYYWRCKEGLMAAGIPESKIPGECGPWTSVPDPKDDCKCPKTYYARELRRRINPEEKGGYIKHLGGDRFDVELNMSIMGKKRFTGDVDKVVNDVYDAVPVRKWYKPIPQLPTKDEKKLCARTTVDELLDRGYLNQKQAAKSMQTLVRRKDIC
ncbi:hypothetical protein TetV_206 [Tetraselmis virus 1]|uniref:Uncharacterized protein n=1 Tax=Tetraselmis virus 1 TaxID=2060617 RepID=A0A2P0VN01_9VIRU|nr:hypothetical protein QJ968_gp206 [Tetraselmis virus 1]AUF82298.1 hypothetical protein TetV_206 [Tetraselmis virus 1]